MQYNTVVKYNSEYSYQYSIRGTSNHQINSTDITSAVITMIQLIQHTSHSYYRVPWQFIIKRKVQSSTNQSSNNCLGVGGRSWLWSVITTCPVGSAINCSLYGYWIFPWLYAYFWNNHTTNLWGATCRSDLLPPILKPGLILMGVWKKNYSQSIIFCGVIRYPTVMGFYLTDSASRLQPSVCR